MNWAGGRTLFSSLTSRLASAAALAALALIAAPGAKADVIETFSVTGNFGTILGPLAPFTGAVTLDFSNDFAVETLTSINISVHGHPVFNQNVSLSVGPSVGAISASNSAGDQLALWFAAPPSGTWVGFGEGDVSFGDVVFSGANVLLGATGTVTHHGLMILAPPPPPIIDPPSPIIDPPPISDPPTPITTGAAPELSTWAMMLLGLTGLGLAAKWRRASAFLGEKA